MGPAATEVLEVLEAAWVPEAQPVAEIINRTTISATMTKAPSPPLLCFSVRTIAASSISSRDPCVPRHAVEPASSIEGVV
jgi:hypothetical protein